ncbi:hypothetical protein ACIBH1_39935 [Nonomuraea sp. NPDC050663]|uniref:hypothetical protein n=1 Tax=Nonomuraea sp. NPDC050663 TaxID=3364370 RepID=UPI00378AA5E0
MSRLERRYRWLLRAYPTGYRSDYGDELLGVLLDRAEPTRASPPAREAWALVLGGVRARIVEAAQGPAWTDGIHLGVMVLGLFNFAVLIPYASSIPVWLGMSGLVVLCVLRGRLGLAIPLALLTGVKVVAITLGKPWLDETLLPVFADAPWDGLPALYGNGGPLAPLASWSLMILGLVALAIREERPRRRSWWWLLAVPLVAGTDPAWLDLVAGSPAAVVRVGLETVLLLAAVYAGHVTGDSRWGLAAALYLLPASAVLIETMATAGRQDVAHWALLLLLTGAATAVPLRARRHVLL